MLLLIFYPVIPSEAEGPWVCSITRRSLSPPQSCQLHSPALRCTKDASGRGSRGQNAAGPFFIAFTEADVFLRRNGFYIEVEALEGYQFIYGSLDQHEFRFPKIVDWLRQHIRPIR